MTKPLTVEQIKQRCFCKFFVREDCDCDMCSIPKGLARAARRFVKMEQTRKRKQYLDKLKCRVKAKITIPRLPKHFGEMRFKKEG